MSSVKLLDCTLRDGAYLVDKTFGNETIVGIIEGLVKCKIDYIEVGFFQDEGFGEGKTVFRNSADAKKIIPKKKENSLFTVLADYSRYSLANLDQCRTDSIDAIRECFFKEERFEAIDACKKIKEKGYKVFVQPVDILGYTDMELLEFLHNVNEVEPYCFSIVDTFGSMYQEDLQHCFDIIDHNLVSTCKIGFHSHNNMQLSSALSQEFVRMSTGKRDIVIDGTISGMGRGAGNTPTELIAQYLISRWGCTYDMDALLDIIDNYMDNIRTRCSWGYNTSYFIAGSYGAHVNNIQYLLGKSSIQSKDIRYILNTIGEMQRKRYDYALLEKTYVEHLMSIVDDSLGISELKRSLGDKDILIIAPGSTATDQLDIIRRYIQLQSPVIISINFIHEQLNADYVYMSNIKRYSQWINREEFIKHKKILASNIKQCAEDETEIIVSFSRLIKCGWEHMDNSTILLLRLLDEIGVKSIAVAGFDGYGDSGTKQTNYATEDLEKITVRENAVRLNEEISSMLRDYKMTREHPNTLVTFVTSSRFEKIFE